MASDSPVDVPSFPDLFNPILAALRTLGGSASNPEIANQVIQDLGLPEEVVERARSSGGTSILYSRLALAKLYLETCALIDNSQRGIWSLTQDGKTSGEIEPRSVVEYVQDCRLDISPDLPSSPEDEPPIRPSDSTDWRETLSETLSAMHPAAFERLCQRLLRESGFIEVEVTGKSGDGGIDGRGSIRFAGLISFPVIFQCKRYSGSVGAAVVRELRGAMQGRADRGLILTTGRFTKEAYKEATRDGAPPIDLIDGDLLIDKLKELQLGVSTEMVEKVTVNTGWFNTL